MPIDRTVFNASVDDDGSGTSGTIKDKDWYKDALLDPIDDAIAADAGSPLTPPPPHATSHQNGGTDEISVVGLSGLLADGQTPLAHKTSHQSGGSDAIKLDDLAAPDDNTDLNATTSAHGLLLKLGGGTTNYLRADGTWNAPAGSGGTPGGSDTQVQFNDSSAFGGDAGLVYNKTTDLLTAGAVSLTLGQLVFPSTQNASANANTLDDYEEGTWTPTLTASSGAIAAYTDQTARYVKIGQWVWVNFNVTINGVGTLSGSVSVAGLPFANGMSSFANVHVIWASLTTAIITLTGQCSSGGTTLDLFRTTAANASSFAGNLGTGDLATATTLRGQFSYRASS